MRKMWVGLVLLSFVAACSDDSAGAKHKVSCKGAQCEGLVTVDASGTHTTEAGAQVTLEMRLSRAPKADVHFTLSVSDDTEASLEATDVTFTKENWNGVQKVVVTGVDDNEADGDQAYQVVFSALDSDDAVFAGFTPPAVDLTNTDDDTAGITVADVSGDTGENGNQATFTVVLNTKPTANVKLALASDDDGEGTAAPATLEFTPDNYNAPQTITVTGVDDDLADGPQDYHVVFQPAESDDTNYAGITPDPVQLTNIDNDTAGITVGDVSGDTGENGDQATFTVVLNSQPTADVTIALASSDEGEGTADPTSLTFTADNWAAPQAVTLTGQDDDVADGDQHYEITFEAAASDDTNYAGITPDPVELLNVDDDTAGINVSAISGDTGENGDQASFTVVLNSQPTDDVTVNFDTDDAGEGTVDNTSLTFTAQNWNAPQTVTVTGQDDDLADGNQPYAITFSATTSNDPAYAAITPANVDVTNVDNDSAGITVSAISGDTTEAGGQATFTVVLTSQPYNDVTVNFDTNDATEGTPDKTSLTFTAQNWNAPQTVTVTGQDDALADGNQPYAITFSATTSNDPAYAAITPGNVDVTNTDNDSAGITVSAISGNTTEAGGQATFSVVLSSQPYNDVTVNFDTNDASEGTPDKTSLTFTAANWNAPQTVTVTGQDDALADGNQPYAITFSATTSNDPAYAAITPGNVDLTNTDNDSAGITVSAISGDTTEAGGQATFTVVLTSQPYNDVTVNFDTNDATEGTPDKTSLTFTAQNWNAPQAVTVTGQDDALADGNQPYAITFSATTSNDPAYAAITPGNVDVTNTDNDSAGITVSAISGNTTEAGGQATFSVVLSSQPYNDVTVNFDTNDASEGTPDKTSLTFTAANWNAPQTVTVTGQDDALADGNQPYAITFSATTSNDPAYAAITPGNVDLTNTDNDSAGITVSAISGDTTEAGGQATFTVVLTSQPYNDVTVNFDTNDATEGTPDKTSLTFTAQNWNAPQAVTVTGQDDALADGNQPYAITFSATTSNDPAYAAITPGNVDVTNTDNDSAGITVSAISGNTTEAGGQATFSVVLSSQPYNDVTVNFDTNDASEGTPDKTSLTFTAANWNAPQTVTVTGQDDALADGNQPYAITFSATTSNDPAYAAITPGNVDLTNTDNDSAGITVSAISGDTTEAGGQATFTVVLTSQPYNDVTVNFDTNDATEGTPDNTSLTFTAQNWNAPQTVTVTGQDDAFADGNQPYAIVFSATSSADAAYAAITPGNVDVTNMDNDSAGITVNTVVGTSTEAGGAANFSVVLNSEPFADVTVNFDTTDATEGVPDVNSLTFNATNWNAPQNVLVRGQDDALADGDQPYAISFSATTSADTTYAAITPANVALTNTDNDTAGITVSPISGNTTEAGGTATFTAVLNSQSFADVTLNFDTTDASEGVPGVTSLTFTAANWNTPQTVTVTGRDDYVVDGNQSYAIAFGATTSSDAAYAAITPGNIAVTNIDNDTAGITVTPATANTSEAGGTATFTVVLNSQPTANVAISYASSDTTEGTVSPGSLTFTPSNWNVAQSFVVHGVDDTIMDGNQAYTINFAPTNSGDPNYNGVSIAQRSLTNIDNDNPPAVGTSGTTGRLSGAPWTVCRADTSTAWLAANNGGAYNPTQACQSIGYARADAWGGTCGTVCGYCGTAGREYYDGGGGSATYLTYTVHWRCAH